MRDPVLNAKGRDKNAVTGVQREGLSMPFTSHGLLTAGTGRHTEVGW